MLSIILILVVLGIFPQDAIHKGLIGKFLLQGNLLEIDQDIAIYP